MSAPLLPLASLPDDALAVIFGPDGDFDGAPMWRPPLWGRLRPHRGNKSDPEADDQQGFVYRYTIHGVRAVIMERDGVWTVDDAALDLRIPSVAARLAGLCARVLWPTQIIDGAVASVYRHGDWVHLAMPHGGMEATWRTAGGFCGGAVDPAARKVLALYPATIEEFSPASLLASLTLALADRIGALPADVDPR